MDDWSTACLDWEDRIRNGLSIIPRPIFPRQAERALEIFKSLRIVDAGGTFGELCEQWVFDLVSAIFGAYDEETGRRLIREVFLLVPKKNTKSTLAAGIMVTALILNWRQSAELIILAPTVEIANNSYGPARDMIRADEQLSALFHVQDYIRTITHRTTEASLKVVAADDETVGGKKGSWILIDEEWIFGKQSNAESMFREATGGLASRPEGIVIKLSTQSNKPPAGIFKQDLEYARDVRDGKISDKELLPVLYEHPRDMVKSGECLKLEHLRMVNPNFGVSVDENHLKREYGKAVNAGEHSIRDFFAKHGNVEVGIALRFDYWAGAEFWEQQGESYVTLDYLLKWSEVVTAGIDGGGLDDLLGLSLIGRHSETGKKLAWTHAWAHPSVLKRRKELVTKFKEFEADGDLTIVKRIGQDVKEVAEVIYDVFCRGLLDKVGVDQSGIGSVLDELESIGIPKDQIVGISQGWRLSGTIKTVERWLAGGEIIHGGRPMMAWCVGNAKTVPAGNAVNITKQVSGSAKIDPLMALFDAAQLMSMNPQAGAGVIKQGFVAIE